MPAIDEGVPAADHNGHFNASLDDGLTRERTVLAWQRTALAMATFSVVLLKALESHAPVIRWFLAAVVWIMAIESQAAARKRFDTTFWRARGHSLTEWFFRTLAAGVGIIGLLALLLSLV